MAAGSSNLPNSLHEEHQNHLDKRSELTVESQNSASYAPREKRKISRATSKSWFNKTFEMPSISSCEQRANKPLRRQRSVSDFFQSMLTKSRSHLSTLFSNTKRENQPPHISNPNTAAMRPRAKLRKAASIDNPPDTKFSYLSFDSVLQPMQPNSRAPYVSLNIDVPHQGDDKFLSKQPQGFKYTEIPNESTSPHGGRSMADKSDLFMASIAKATRQRNHSETRSNSPLSTSTHSLTSRRTSQTETRSSSENLVRQRSSFERTINPTSSLITLSVIDFTEKNENDDSDVDLNNELEGDSRRRSYKDQTHGPSMGRLSLHIEPSPLVVSTKRSLVKSNSDTITKLNTSLDRLVKASSDGNCFWTNRLKCNLQGSVITKVTDYLYIGSVEAAYSQPLLCKLQITSLIDMTNVQPHRVPQEKKSDCPCPCINKHHFRSKLNIGLDDIEWENLEQYFGEINAFIEGCRKKKGRILIFSYLGLSRAPAAAIQHLMHRYEMSFNEAYSIILTKRPKSKLNSGFIKTLQKLEIRLNREKGQNIQSDGTSEDGSVNDESVERSSVGRKSSSEAAVGSMPPVVRGAWLEC